MIKRDQTWLNMIKRDETCLNVTYAPPNIPHLVNACFLPGRQAAWKREVAPTRSSIGGCCCFPLHSTVRLCHFFRLKYIRKKLGSTGKANWIYCKSLSQQANEEIHMYALEIPRHTCKLHQLFLLNFSFLLQSEVLRQSGQGFAGRASTLSASPFSVGALWAQWVF